jgi:hypothetical protein
MVKSRGQISRRYGLESDKRMAGIGSVHRKILLG